MSECVGSWICHASVHNRGHARVCVYVSKGPAKLWAWLVVLRECMHNQGYYVSVWMAEGCL